MKEEQQAEHHVRPVAVLFIALLSIGGLLYLGWQANLASGVTGNVAAEPYASCCTTQEWRSSSTGFSQGFSSTRSVICGAHELSESCCVRDAAQRSRYPVRLIGAKEGYCAKDAPKKEYPSNVPRGQRFDVCCSVQTWKHAPTGYAQGNAQTFTGYCEMFETANQCCVRSGKDFTGSSSVRLIGSKLGACGGPVPQTSYPVWIR